MNTIIVIHIPRCARIITTITIITITTKIAAAQIVGTVIEEAMIGSKMFISLIT